MTYRVKDLRKTNPNVQFSKFSSKIEKLIKRLFSKSLNDVPETVEEASKNYYANALKRKGQTVSLNRTLAAQAHTW